MDIAKSLHVPDHFHNALSARSCVAVKITLALNWHSRRSSVNPFKGGEGAEFGRQQNFSPQFQSIDE
jgi:hypothetical protein